MDCALSWMVENAPAISAMAACVALAVSVLAYRQNRKPDVIVYLESDTKSNYVYLCIGNFGSGTAHDISIKMSEVPPIEDEIDSKHLEPFLNNGVPTLPPGAIRKTSAGTMDDPAYSDVSKSYVAKVTYFRKRGLFRLPIYGKYSLDFHTFWESVENFVQY